MPQVNLNLEVTNKDLVNDKDIIESVKKIESDLTVGRVLIRPSGTENKIRIMIEANQEKVASKYANDLLKLFKSKL